MPKRTSTYRRIRDAVSSISLKATRAPQQPLAQTSCLPLEQLESRLLLNATSFDVMQAYTTGSSPMVVVSADFNGDGQADMVVANAASNTVSVFLNTGSGTFAKTDYSTGSTPYSVTTADFNGDGKMDLAVANYGANTVSVLLGSGTGTFAAKVDYATGSQPTSVTAADFNGDGKIDLAVANYGANTVSVLLGSGTGTFAAKSDTATGNAPFSVTSADFNGDGKADLATANFSSNSVSVLMGTGTGTFATKVDYTTGNSPYSVTAADFNGDGVADLAVTSVATNTVGVLLNYGSGLFAAKADYTTGTHPYSVTVGDFNGDGKMDLATANYTGNTVSVLLGSGVGTFASKLDYTTGNAPGAVTAADLNGDGKADLVVANRSDNTIGVLTSHTNSVTFSDTDMSGLWIYTGMDAVGTFQFDASGSITSGYLNYADGSSGTPSGTYSIAIDGTLTVTTSGETKSGSMNSARDTITLTAPGTSGYNSLGVLVKINTARAFSVADVTGTWALYNNGDANGSTGLGQLIFDGAGHVLAGTSQNTNSTTVFTGGTYTVAASGAVTVLLNYTGGASAISLKGAINGSGDTLALDTTNLSVMASGGGVRMMELIRQSDTYSNADMSGTWRVVGDRVNGYIILDGAGSVTSGTVVGGDGNTETITGSYTVSSAGIFSMTLNAVSTSGTVVISRTGALNASRNIVATIQQPSSSTDNSDSLTMLVRAADVAPTDIALSSASVEQKLAIGTAIGIFTSTDLDADAFTYSLAAGTGSTDNASFTIAGNVLKTNAVFDYATKNSYFIRVRSTDQSGLSTEKVFAILVTDTQVWLDTPTVSSTVNQGLTYRIQWDGGTASTTVQLWACGPNGWSQISGNIASSVGYYDWDTSGSPHGWYYFTAQVNPGGGKYWYTTNSPNWLHVVNPTNHTPTVTFTTSASAVSITKGATYNITWTAADADSDTLHIQLWAYSSDTGWFVVPGADWLDASTGTFTWNTVSQRHGWYSFAAHVWDGSAQGVAASPNWLHIVQPAAQAPSLTFTTPTSGQTVAHGNAFNIDWTASIPAGDTGKMRVQLWACYLDYKNGNTPVWIKLADNLDPTANSFAWDTTSLSTDYQWYSFSAWIGYDDLWSSCTSTNWLHVA